MSVTLPEDITHVKIYHIGQEYTPSMKSPFARCVCVICGVGSWSYIMGTA